MLPRKLLSTKDVGESFYLFAFQLYNILPRLFSCSAEIMATREKSAPVKPPSKSETISYIAEKTGHTKAQVNLVFDTLITFVAESLKKYKQFTIPGLVKITVVHKAAKQARPGRNPFTGEAITVKAKPAHDAIRVRALKRLKIMV